MRSDLIEACQQPGCPVCRLSWRAALNYLDITLYENANDPDTQADLRRARGYCNRHAWQMLNKAADR